MLLFRQAPVVSWRFHTPKADYNNWQINDYGGFIKNLKNEYKLLSEDTIISSESRVLYKRYSQYMSDLETNYNKVINEPKYA